MNDNNSNVLIYGRNVPLVDGKTMWIGMHPLLFDKEKCENYIRRKLSDPGMGESNIFTRLKKSNASCSTHSSSSSSSFDGDDGKEDKSAMYNEQAMSVVFHRICLAMEEAPVHSRLPDLKVCDDCNMLVLMPGHVSTPPGCNELERLIAMTGKKDSDGKKQYIQVPWIFPIGKEKEKKNEKEKKRTGEDDDMRSTFDSKFIYRCDSIRDHKVTSIRTSSWMLSEGDETQAMRALIEGAFIYTAMTKASEFSIRKHGAAPLVSFEKMNLQEKGNVVIFSVAWVFTKPPEDHHHHHHDENNINPTEKHKETRDNDQHHVEINSSFEQYVSDPFYSVVSDMVHITESLEIPKNMIKKGAESLDHSKITQTSKE